eukprot:3803879-Rhodomonas_salina.2
MAMTRRRTRTSRARALGLGPTTTRKWCVCVDVYVCVRVGWLGLGRHWLERSLGEDGRAESGVSRSWVEKSDVWIA